MDTIVDFARDSTGGGQRLLDVLRDQLQVNVPAKLAPLLIDATNPHAIYDLVGVLKSAFIERIFVQPNADECMPVAQAVVIE